MLVTDNNNSPYDSEQVGAHLKKLDPVSLLRRSWEAVIVQDEAINLHAPNLPQVRQRRCTVQIWCAVQVLKTLTSSVGRRCALEGGVTSGVLPLIWCQNHSFSHAWYPYVVPPTICHQIWLRSSHKKWVVCKFAGKVGRATGWTQWILPSQSLTEGTGTGRPDNRESRTFGLIPRDRNPHKL